MRQLVYAAYRYSLPGKTTAHTYWLKEDGLLAHDFVGQKFWLGSSGWFFCWSWLGSFMHQNFSHASVVSQYSMASLTFLAKGLSGPCVFHHPAGQPGSFIWWYQSYKCSKEGQAPATKYCSCVHLHYICYYPTDQSKPRTVLEETNQEQGKRKRELLQTTQCNQTLCFFLGGGVCRFDLGDKARRVKKDSKISQTEFKIFHQYILSKYYVLSSVLEIEIKKTTTIRNKT